MTRVESAPRGARVAFEALYVHHRTQRQGGGCQGGCWWPGWCLRRGAEGWGAVLRRFLAAARNDAGGECRRELADRAWGRGKTRTFGWIAKRAADSRRPAPHFFLP